jgi:transcriptional regulator with XRE-family HTH domain
LYLSRTLRDIISYMEISVELKVLVVRSGLSKKAIANETGMSASKISKILNAQQVPDWADIVSIGRVCGFEINCPLFIAKS